MGSSDCAGAAGEGNVMILGISRISMYAVSIKLDLSSKLDLIIYSNSTNVLFLNQPLETC
jgi:hypothetical protein